MSRRCASCSFYREHGLSVPQVHYGEPPGECFAYPPQVVAVDIGREADGTVNRRQARSVRPKVGPDDVCLYWSDRCGSRSE